MASTEESRRPNQQEAPVSAPVVSDIQHNEPAGSQEARSSITVPPSQSASPPRVEATAILEAVPVAKSANSPEPRSGTPSSQMPALTTINGLGPAPDPVAQATGKGQDQLNVRWRLPLTVKYDGGQAQPGVVHSTTATASNGQGPVRESPQQPPPAAQSQPSQEPTVTLPQPPQQPQPQPPPPQQQQQHQPAPSAHPHPHPHPHPHAAPHPPALPLPSQHAQPLQAHHQQSAPQTRPAQISPPPPLPSQQYQHTYLLSQQSPLPSPTSTHSSQFQSQSHYHFKQYHPRPPAPTKRPIIMDPPAVRRASQPPPQPSQGFPSPAQDYARLNPKFVDDCTRMTYAIQQSLPEAVRRIVRDHWEKCLLGSEFHQAFILNASIHHALPVITQRAVRDFGGKMVADSLVELVGHISTQDLDKVADLIIAKASDDFLDKCLEKRLLTIEAKPLTQALAKAERLGFGPDDEIQQEGPHERVMPHEAYPGASTATNGSFQGHHTPPAPGYHPAQPLQCSRCYRTFGQPQPFDYHMRYNVCSQIPPTANGFATSCQHCGQGFDRGEDLQGHLHGKQCGNFDAAQAPPPAVKASRGPGRPPRAAPVAQVNPVSILPSQGPAPNGQLSSQPQSTPVASRVASHVAGTPGTAGSPNTSDPYAHLSDDQRNAMNAELHEAELKYGPRFAEAELIADENERRTKIDGLRNSFGTKQSMIRKKYGVRLRERRTKAEIAAEKERLGIKRAEKELAARESLGTTPQQNVGQAAAVASDVHPRPAGGGWTAANTPKVLSSAAVDEHDAKRRRVADGGGYVTPYKSVADETPTRKVSSGQDVPAAALASISRPEVSSRPSSQPSKEPSSLEMSNRLAPLSTPASGQLKPEQLGSIAIDDDSSSSDDEDIPPTLPAHVRKSLLNSPLRKASTGMLGSPHSAVTPP